VSKKAKYIFFTDVHITDQTANVCEDIFDQILNISKELGVKDLICGGDVFTSRKGQPLKPLTTFYNFVKQCEENSLHLNIIPGNHDKTNYKIVNSFLDVFKLSNNVTVFDQDGPLNDDIYMAPFFDADDYIKRISKVNTKFKLLITHIGVKGAKSNSGVEIESKIGQDLFNNFDTVLIGHYHDIQILSDKIIYTGSCYQGNFGEDERKGCWVIYDDYSLDFIQLQSPKYTTIKVDSKDIDAKFVDDIISNKESGHNYRVMVKGIKGKNLDPYRIKLQENGIKFVTNLENSVISSEDTVKRVKFNAQEISLFFSEWLEIKDPQDIEYGRNIINKLFN
jgi:DNA repair exonuclease SbcCD nuclease subunit